MTQTGRIGARDQRLRMAVTEWLATPKWVRREKTLEDLATSLGLVDAAELYALGAGDPDYNQKLLQATATQILPHLPKVMAILLKAAQKGSVRAAEILLEHVRKTIQSHPTQQVPNSPIQLNTIISGLPNDIAQLAKLAEAMGSDPTDAQEKLEDWRSQEALNARSRAVVLLDGPRPSGVIQDMSVFDEDSPFPEESGGLSTGQVTPAPVDED